jgi:hypothetical protein
MGCWAETKATYRFITNPRVTAERILGPHKEATASRMKEHPVVLAVQDTTELNYTSHEALEDIGFLARKRDGHPGPTVLWRGLQELATICFAWFAFGPGRPQS